MNVTLWGLQIVLALIFILPGWGKISNSREQHIADGHIQPQSSLLPVRILGILEWLGCIGIIVPWLTGIYPILTPVAALCFCMIMIAGIINHTIKKEYKMLPMLSIILIVAAIVAYYRFQELL